MEPAGESCFKSLDRIARSPESLSRPFLFTLSGSRSPNILKVLERAGTTRRVKTGKFHRFRLDTGPFTKAQRVMDELAGFWQQRLDQLENYPRPAS